MQFYHPLLVSEKLKKKEKKICRKLRFGIGMTNVFVITLNVGNDLFDIYHCVFFKPKFMRKRDILIIGLAESHDAAVSLLSEFMADIYRETGNTDFKAYFEQADKHR